MSNLQVISEELNKDIETGMLDLTRQYDYVIDECPHTGDFELCILGNYNVFGEYLYNSASEANIDIQILELMGFNLVKA